MPPIDSNHPRSRPSRTLFRMLAGGAATLLSSVALATAPGETIEQASRHFDDAQFRRDRPAIMRQLASDMVYISGAGRIGGVTEFVAAFSGQGVEFDPFIIKDRRIVMLSRDVGVVTADGTIQGSEKGSRFSEHFRYSDTFARRNNQWRVVYVQVTKLPNR